MDGNVRLLQTITPPHNMVRLYGERLAVPYGVCDRRYVSHHRAMPVHTFTTVILGVSNNIVQLIYARQSRGVGYVQVSHFVGHA